MKRSASPFFVVLGGPTGVGKSSAAVEIASRFDGEVINADSRQIYRGFDIGTGKVTPEEARGIPHHLYDVADGRERFSAFRVLTLAAEKVREIHSRGKLPLVVGGTGLYIRALLHGLFKETGSDPGLRAHLVERAEEVGWGALYAELRGIDPSYAATLSPNDRVRIIRALEVFKTSGRPISEHFRETRPPLPEFRSLRIFLTQTREELYRRIDARVEEMFRQGLEEEVRRLLQEGYDPSCPGFQSIGYRDVLEFLRGETPKSVALENMQRLTRNYAKRQIVWFKKEKGFLHLPVSQGETLLRLVQEELS